MAARTAYDPVNGTALTETNLEKFAGGWIGHVEVAAVQGSITTEVDLTGLAVTVTVNTSRRIKLEAFGSLQSTVGGDLGAIFIKESATQLSAAQKRLETSNTFVYAVAILTPSGGSHTYKLTAARTSGTGTVTMTASATQPAFFLVSDLGPAA
jgi:hypothetical protein